MLRFKSLFVRLFSLGVILMSSMLVTTSPPIVRAQTPNGAANVSATQTAIGTAFTYQGRLNDNGAPANGTYDFIFALYDAETGGNPVDTSHELNDVQVKDGFFTVQLDFGNAFDGNARYLDIGVRPGASTGIYTPLHPRHAITAVPYALALPNVSTRNSNVGIGTSTPERKLHVVGDEIRLQNGSKLLEMYTTGLGVDMFTPSHTLAIQSTGTGPCPWECNNVVINPFGNNGNVGIGTEFPNPNYKLNVVGDVLVQGRLYLGTGAELKVPDYVFETGYTLMPLEKLAAYITREKHLPGVPSQAEIKRDGLNLSQFHMNLLEKTEQLTLYTLAQQKQIDAQQQQITALQQSLAKLEERLAKLEQGK